MSQGLWLGLWQLFCGVQLPVWFPTKPDLQGPHL